MCQCCWTMPPRQERKWFDPPPGLQLPEQMLRSLLTEQHSALVPVDHRFVPRTVPVLVLVLVLESVLASMAVSMLVP